MAPHSLDTILVQPTWPSALSDFVTWCLMWDPKNRPTCAQALAHEYFRDAVDPLKRPKSSSKLLGRKQSSLSTHDSNKENSEHLPSLSTKTSSWFRRSLIQREVSAPAIPQHAPPVVPNAAPAPLQPVQDTTNTLKPKPNANKRATWANGPSNAAPIPILPSIRPVSPLSDAVTAQATVRRSQMQDHHGQKVGRQLSQSNQSRDAERALSGQSGLVSPTSSQRESFFSHLRKRARRFSGRYQAPMSPNDDLESQSGATWSNNRHSQHMTNLPPIGNEQGEFSELDKALQGARTSLDVEQVNHGNPPATKQPSQGGNALLKRHHSTGSNNRSSHPSNRKAAHKQSHQNLQYETPDEEDEILNEAIAGARQAASHMDYAPYGQNMATPEHLTTGAEHGYLMTPSPSANRNSAHYGQTDYQPKGKPLGYQFRAPRPAQNKWPTPPYDNDAPKADWPTDSWAQSTMNTIFASARMYD